MKTGLLLSTALLLAFASMPAVVQAQSGSEVLPPEREVIDDNGINVATARYRLEHTDLVLGSGVGKLAVRRIDGESIYQNAKISSANFGNGVRIGVSVGSESYAFQATPSGFATTNGDGATLIRAGQGYELRSSSGISFKFVQIYNPDTDHPENDRYAYLSEIIEPNGNHTYVNWEVVEYLTCRSGGLEYCQALGQFGDFSEHHYMNAIRLSTISNTAGYAVDFFYAGQLTNTDDIPEWSRVIGITGYNQHGGSGSLPSITISGNAFSETVTNAAGVATTYTSSSIQHADGSSVSIASSPYGTPYPGRVTSVTRNGATWTYAYAEPSANASSLVVTDPHGKTRRYTSNKTIGLPTRIEDEVGAVTQFIYDPAGRLTTTISPSGQFTTKGYDARGNVYSTTVADKNGENPLTSLAYYAPDCSTTVACNKPISTVDPRQVTTSYGYDPTHGGLISMIIQNGTPASSANIQIRYAQIAGVWLPVRLWSCRTQSTCENTGDAVQTTASYNANLLVDTITQGAGDNSLTATTSLTYSAAGDVVAADGPLAGAVDIARFSYDAARRLTSTVAPDPDGAGPRRSNATATHYNIKGQVETQQAGSANADGSGFTSSEQVTVAYDAVGRKIRDTLTGAATSMVSRPMVMMSWAGSDARRCGWTLANGVARLMPVRRRPAGPTGRTG